MRRRLTHPGMEVAEQDTFGRVRRVCQLGRWLTGVARTVAALVTGLAVALAGPGAPIGFAEFIGEAGPETQVTVTTRVNEAGGRVAVASDAAGRFAVTWAY